MRLVERYLWYVAPFWVGQFLLLAIATPDPKYVWVWWVFTIAFNALALFLSYNVEKMRRKNEAEKHKKKYGRDLE